MGKIFNICMNFMRLVLKKKSKIFVYILLPPLLAVVFMFMVSAGSSQATLIGVNDEDNSAVSNHIIDYLKNSRQYRLVEIQSGKVNSAISNREVRGAIVIPEGFEESIISGEKDLKIQLVSIEGAAITGWLDGFLTQKINVIQKAAEVSKDREGFYHLLNEYEDKYVQMSVHEVLDVSNKMDSTRAGFGIFIFVSISAVWGICMLTFFDRKLKTYQRIMTTPVRHFEYIAGNALACLLFAIMHILISLTVIYLVFDLSGIITPLQMAALMLALYICVIPLGLLLVSLSRGQGGVAAVNILILSLTSMLGGCYWPLEIMPDFMQKLARITPQFWYMDSLEKVLKTGRISSVILNIGILIISGVIFSTIYILRSSLRKNIMEA